jgi:catalase (peroxidase I)
MGGCNGCIDPTVIDNRGLDEPVEKLYPLVQKYQDKFSRADVWAYCAIVAADMAVVENRPEDLHFYMHYIGRKDCDGADEKGGFGEVSI